MKIRVAIVLPSVLALLCVAALTHAMLEPGARWRTLARADTAGKPAAIEPSTEVVVRGSNPGPEIVAAWLRIDDTHSTGYAERVNEALALPPGEFELQRSLSGLRTPSGRALALGDRLRLQVFTGPDGEAVRIDSIRLEPGPALPPGAKGWDFGPEQAPLFPGFESVAPDSQLVVKGAGTRGVLRPAGDALVRDGIRGLSALRLPLAPGRWRLSLWLNDGGEWEYLPHFMDRRVSVNGRRVLDEHHSPEEFLREVYLGGADHEPLTGAPLWNSVATKVNEPLNVVVDNPTGTVEIRFESRNPDSRFVAAVLAEPVGGTALEALQALRSKRFDARWPRAEPPAARAGGDLQVRCRPPAQPEPEAGMDCTRITGAAGTMLSLDLEMSADPGLGAVEVDLEAGAAKAAGIDTVLRHGHWAYRRGNGMLVLNDDRLRSFAATVPVHPNLPRRINLQLFLAATAAPGSHRLILHLRNTAARIELPIDVQVLPIALPPARAPAGVFYETLPVFAWFDGMAGQRTRAMACDYALLGRLGLNALAPSLREPLPGRVAHTVNDLSVAEAAGFREPLIAYTPLRRSMARGGQAGTLATLQELESALDSAGMSSPLWIVADEPGDTRALQSRLAELVLTLRSARPRSQFGAFLNSPGSASLAGLLDVAFINHGYGIDSQSIAQRLASGRHTWLYNLPDARSAAGLLLWHTGAQGYLQWHARMPTAAPFDPSDGREGDYLLIYPSADPCPATADIDARLLELAAGVVDQRWLQWLESRAGSDAAARVLLERIRESLPRQFRPGDPLPPAAVARAWRRAVTDYAAGVSTTPPRS